MLPIKNTSRYCTIGLGAATLGAAGIGAAAGIIGGKAANAASALEAKKNRDFQERMTKNKHRYEVKDLRKAGLNPILSAHGGASVPSGATAQQKNIIPDNTVSNATTALLAYQQLKNLEATETNIEANTGKTDAETKNIENTIDIKGPLAGAARGLTGTAKVLGKGVGHAYDLADDTAQFIGTGIENSAQGISKTYKQVTKEINEQYERDKRYIRNLYKRTKKRFNRTR